MSTKYGIICHRGMRIRVKILKERKNFGRTDLLIEPAAGTGTTWTRQNAVKQDNKSKG